MAADQPGLAQIGIDMGEARLAQHAGDAVGNETLTDRIQGDAHSRTSKGYPARSDVEPKPARLFRGYKRYVVHPEEYKNHDEVVKLYSQILKTR